jgi:NAD(P)-dependent dehydrogenase (short-subunit alcohol dehydrogenase family)
LAREGCDVAAVEQAFGRLDILVNNAGTTKRGDAFALSKDDWRDGFALKFFGSVRLTRTNPGAIETDRLLPRIKRYAEAHALALDEARRRLLQDVAVARFGSADEIAAAVAFLASPLAASMQGGVVDIDGGATRTL